MATMSIRTNSGVISAKVGHCDQCGEKIVIAEFENYKGLFGVCPKCLKKAQGLIKKK